MSDNKWDKRFLFDIMSDATPVSNILLKNYRQMGLTDGEVVFLIQLIMLNSKGISTVEDIAENIGSEASIVKQNLASLMEKGFILSECTINPDKSRISKYYPDGLYDRIMDTWACEMAEKNSAQTKKPLFPPDENFALVFNSFEKEFGRPLSPMEKDKIVEWLDVQKYSPELILESLKRSVLRGIYNFNYVDKILLEWQKANVRTLNEIPAYDKNKPPKDKTVRKKTVASKGQSFKGLYEI